VESHALLQIGNVPTRGHGVTHAGEIVVGTGKEHANALAVRHVGASRAVALDAEDLGAHHVLCNQLLEHALLVVCALVFPPVARQLVDDHDLAVEVALVAGIALAALVVDHKHRVFDAPILA
jgi:hypothetical protein